MERPDAPQAQPPSPGAARDRLILLGVALLLLVPFLWKPVNIDGAFFLAIAKNITSNPLHPYDFHYNWTGRMDYVWDEMKNPPFIFYFQALLLKLGIRSELGLNLSFLIFPATALLGMDALARRAVRRPLYPSLLLLLSPAFLVCATSIMMDTALLAFYTVAVAAFVAGAEEDRNDLRVLSGIAAALAVLTKYFALSLIPLLGAYALLRRKNLRANLLVLLLPAGTYLLWHLYGVILHGQAHLFSAIHYGAARHGSWTEDLRQAIATLTFTGGLLAVPLLSFAPLGRRRGPLALILALGFSAGLLRLAEHRLGFPATGPNRVLFLAFSAGALLFLELALRDTLARHDPFGWLLRLWLWGGVAFCLLNWTVNARTVLLFAPPALLLFARWTEEAPWLRRGALALTLALGLVVAAADYDFATFGPREAAWAVGRFGAGSRVRFIGHWGFQYYMERAGFHHVDFGNPDLEPGDRVIIAKTHTASNRPLRELPPARAIVTIHYQRPRIPILTTNPFAGAGLHGSFLGLLPFVYSRLPLETVEVREW